MPHKPPIRSGESIDSYLRRVEAEHAADKDGGDGVKLPLSIQPIGGGVGMLVDADGVPVVGDDGMPILRNVDTPGTGTAPSFASTQAAQTQAEEFARAQAAQAATVAAEAAEARRRFEEEQAEIDRELRLREARLATARDLVNIRSAEAREARTLGTQISGEDPFTFTAIARGLQGPTGQTPSAGFKQNLMGAAQFQAPELAGLDSAALESAIGKLSQSNVPQGSPTFGFAHGGTVGGGTTRPGDGTVALDVGEPINGMPNPEVVILRPDGSVEVVRKAGAAQQGGTFDLGGFGPLFDRLRTSVNPTGVSFRDDPNRVRSIFGFLPPGVEQETSASFQAFANPARGTLLNIRQGMEEALGFQGLDPAAARMEARRLDQLIGSLPAPHKIPFSFFQALFPTEQNALIKAYRLSGVPEEDFEHLRTAPQLSFAPQRATAVG